MAHSWFWWPLLSELKFEKVEKYLSDVYKTAVKVLQILPFNGERAPDLKSFGYGSPCTIEFTVEDQTKLVVLRTLRPGGFGRDHFADRAGTLLWQNSSFNKLPRHVHSVDVGSFLNDGQSLKSLGDCVEFFLLTEFVEGSLYQLDLDRISKTCELVNLDEERCVALADYLAEIHSVKNKDEPELYFRRLRDLLGHGEGTFGLTDSYPNNLSYVNEKFFVEFEKRCLEWRWRLKHKAQRLSQVHGNFHPRNIMFRQGNEFTVLDRRWGDWGEPAEDVATLTINYLFYSLQSFGEMNGPFGRLFALFWKNYLDRTGDDEMLKAVQPFYAWRGVALASPLQYPNLSVDVRKKILRFAEKIISCKEFEFESVESYVK
jgi:hypothetical protein